MLMLPIPYLFIGKYLLGILKIMTISLRIHTLITYICNGISFNDGFCILKAVIKIKAAYTDDIQSFCCDLGYISIFDSHTRCPICRMMFVQLGV